MTLNQFQLLEATDTGTTGTIFTNGVQQNQNTAMNTINNLTRSNNYIGQGSGGGNYFNGQIAEILFYNTALTTTQQADLESYIEQRYQFSSQVPAAPIISVGTSTLNGPTQVAIAANPAAQIRYTQNGTSPSLTSPLYTGPINVYYSQTLNAIAVINGISSSISTAAYTLDPTQWQAPSSTDTRTLQLDLQTPEVSQP